MGLDISFVDSQNEPCFTVQRSTCCFSFLQFPRPGTLRHLGGGEEKSETKNIKPAPRKWLGKAKPQAPCLMPNWHLRTREPAIRSRFQSRLGRPGLTFLANSSISSSGSHSVVHGNSLEMKILGPHHRPEDSGTLGWAWQTVF